MSLRETLQSGLERPLINDAYIATHSKDVLTVRDEIELSKAISLKRIADHLDWLKSVAQSPTARKIATLVSSDLINQLTQDEPET